jgi:hypothetical protein
MRFMQRSKDSLAKWLSAILPVVIVGLVGLFAVTVIRDYGRARHYWKKVMCLSALWSREAA